MLTWMDICAIFLIVKCTKITLNVKIKKCYEKYINTELELKEMPQLRFGTPDVRIGNKYKIVDVEGSNFWLIDDSGDKVSFGRVVLYLLKMETDEM